jgi:hypothetical protein
MHGHKHKREFSDNGSISSAFVSHHLHLVNFINILRAPFLPISFRKKIRTETVGIEKLRLTLLFGKS